MKTAYMMMLDDWPLFKSLDTVVDEAVIFLEMYLTKGSEIPYVKTLREISVAARKVLEELEQDPKSYNKLLYDFNKDIFYK